MGRYINPPSTGFEYVIGDGHYVDKTELLAYTNAVMNTSRRFVCFTRPRRFGKTFAAQMISAFYSKGAKSRHLFQGDCMNYSLTIALVSSSPSTRPSITVAPMGVEHSCCSVSIEGLAPSSAGQ